MTALLLFILTFAPENSQKLIYDSSYRFFQNTGAVAGVFVLVGLAATSILIFVFFYIRRRRRRALVEHDTAVSATLAAAGFTRRALDDDLDEAPGSANTRFRDSDGDPFGANRSTNHSPGSAGALEMGQRSSSHLSGRNSAYFYDPPNPTGFNPTEFGYAVPMGPPGSGSSSGPPGATLGAGYIPVSDGERGSPVPGHSPGPSIGGATALGEKGHGHNASAGSYEPLLGTWWASHGQAQSENVNKDDSPAATASSTPGGSKEGGGSAVPTPPPRNPRRLVDLPLASSAGQQSKPTEDLLGLGNLAGGTWAPKDQPAEVRDDASSVYSTHTAVDAHENVAKILQAKTGAGKPPREGTEDASLFGDHEDYSKRVGGGGILGVRNATDLDRERRGSLDS